MVESDTNRYDNKCITGCHWPYDDQTGTAPLHQEYIIYYPAADRYARLRDFTNDELLTELRRRIEDK